METTVKVLSAVVVGERVMKIRVDHHDVIVDATVTEIRPSTSCAGYMTVTFQTDAGVVKGIRAPKGCKATLAVTISVEALSAWSEVVVQCATYDALSRRIDAQIRYAI